MIKKSLIFMLAIVCLSAVASRAEEVKITTYYPSPYGVYKGLSTTGKTTLATDNTDANNQLLVGTTTYPYASPPKLYVLGSAEADAFRAFEASGVNAFIEAKADPVIKWANIGGFNKSTNGFAPTHLDGNPLALQVKSLSNVGIGTTTPSASAKLEVSSTNQGFLPPRVFDATSIAAPAAGLMVYDTNGNQMKYWNGTVWVPMSGAAAGHVGKPEFDSGWIDFPSVGKLISTGKNIPPDQQLVDLEFSPVAQSTWPGINYMMAGQLISGSTGTTSWISKTNTSIVIYNNLAAAAHQQKIRVRIWIVDN